MISGQPQLFRQDSKGLTLDEIFITQQESLCFINPLTKQRLRYEDVATRIKKYGFGGIHTLTGHHMSLILSEQKSFDIYKNKDSNQVTNLLLTFFTMCQHQSSQTQAQDLWQLLNPMFDEVISSSTLFDALKLFSRVAVDCALILLSQYEVNNSYDQQMMNQSLKFLRYAFDMKEQFLEEFIENIPAQLTFDEFKSVVEALCFTPSQLRMAITRTAPSSVGLKLVNSGPATVIISFLTEEERQEKQSVCRKWYNLFIPQMITFVTINKAPDQNLLFRLHTLYEGQKYYLGAQRKLITDTREDDTPEEIGRTTFVSAGTDLDYLQFKWRLDSDGRLILHDVPAQSKMPKLDAYLGAHRTYKMDIRGNMQTYILVTTFKGHENLWKIKRVGEQKANRCIIQITNTKCVNDKVNHIGWSVDLPERNTTAQDLQEGNQWFDKKERPFRSPDSVYVMLIRPTKQQQEGLKSFRTWTLEVVGRLNEHGLQTTPQRISEEN